MKDVEFWSLYLYRYFRQWNGNLSLGLLLQRRIGGGSFAQNEKVISQESFCHGKPKTLFMTDFTALLQNMIICTLNTL